MPYVQLGVFTTHDSPDRVSQTFKSRGSLYVCRGFCGAPTGEGEDFEVIEYPHEKGTGGPGTQLR